MTLGLAQAGVQRIAALFQMPKNIIGLNNEKLISANDKLFVRRAIFVWREELTELRKGEEVEQNSYESKTDLEG